MPASMRIENAAQFKEEEEEPPPRKRRGRQDSRSGKRHHPPRNAPPRSDRDSAPTAGGYRMKLHVGNLHYETGSEDLRAYFESIGEVYSAKVIYERNGKSRGWAIVEYYSNRDARQAIKDLHETHFDDRKIRAREFNE